jgi:predicted ATPase with chaperone activity
MTTSESNDGYIVVSAYDGWRIQLMKIDNTGEFVWNYELPSNYVNAVPNLIKMNGVHVKRVEGDEYRSVDGESTEAVLKRVLSAREAQMVRGALNRDLSDRDLTGLPISNTARDLLVQSLESGAITARGAVRIRRVAQTLADFEDSSVDDDHVAEALSLRASW